MENKKKTIRVGILSDTHGSLPDEVVEKLQGCDYILHAGDVTSEWILEKLRPICKYLYVVRGNCDRDYWARNIKDRQFFEIGGLKFLMVHDAWDVGSLLTKADVVIHGHTHVYSEEYRHDRLWFNPGSVGRPRYGAPPTMAIMEITDKKPTITRIVLGDADDSYFF